VGRWGQESGAGAGGNGRQLYVRLRRGGSAERHAAVRALPRKLCFATRSAPAEPAGRLLTLPPPCRPVAPRSARAPCMRDAGPSCACVCRSGGAGQPALPRSAGAVVRTAPACTLRPVGVRRASAVRDDAVPGCSLTLAESCPPSCRALPLLNSVQRCSRSG